MEELDNLVKRLENEDDDQLKHSLLSSATIETMELFLDVYGLKKESKKVLAVLYMKIHPLFTDETHDLIMKNEVERFYLELKRYCNREIDDIKKDVIRVVRFYNAWYAEDVKMIQKFVTDGLYENSI